MSRTKYNHHFKHMTTVGEPIEPVVWHWYHDVVGKGEAVIVDTWWQTENGGFLCSTKPALDAMKPGSAGPAYQESTLSSTTRMATKSCRLRSGRKHLHPKSLARNHADDLGRQLEICTAVLLEVLRRPREQGLA